MFTHQQFFARNHRYSRSNVNIAHLALTASSAHSGRIRSSRLNKTGQSTGILMRVHSLISLKSLCLCYHYPLWLPKSIFILLLIAIKVQPFRSFWSVLYYSTYKEQDNNNISTNSDPRTYQWSFCMKSFSFCFPHALTLEHSEGELAPWYEQASPTQIAPSGEAGT